MAAELTEKIVVLLTPEQKTLVEARAHKLKQAGEQASVGEVVRRALFGACCSAHVDLFLSSDVSASKHQASSK